MAREAGLEIVHFTSTPEAIERFASLVAAAEREECAKLIEHEFDFFGDEFIAAAAIRARCDELNNDLKGT
jgi:hypothetical protein